MMNLPIKSAKGGWKSYFRSAFSWLILLLSPVLAFQCAEWFTHNPWEIMTFRVALWNILFYEMVYLLIFFLTGRVRIACIAGDLLFLLCSLANYFVVQFRSAPIVPWDVFSIRTAASVANDFSYTLTPQAAVCLAVYFLLIVLAVFAKGRIRPLLPRLLVCAALCAGIFCYVRVLHDDGFIKSMKLDNTLFTPYYMSRKNGMTTAFLMDLRYLHVEQPEEYSAREEEELLSAYTEEAPEKRPNIVVIMDEAFSDPAVLGDFDTNMDYMPYVHSLQEGAENTITGTLNVSVKGGNTANTEYEFLTGHSMRFLPAGSVPYQQYIFGEKASYASWLKELGYSAIAIHPYNANGWNRDRVYPWLGFDTFLSAKNFSSPTRVRKYIDDPSCFRKIIDLYESKEAGTPLFVFAVTMQNHSGYFADFDNFTVDVDATGCDSRILNRYLSLMKLSDEALRDFISYFSSQQEETIVVFFGDHQPNDVVVEPIWKLQGKKGSDLTDRENDIRYQVPYVIWANFDIDEGTGPETSVNYLASHVLRQAGLPLPAFGQYMETIEQEIPVLTTQRFLTADGLENEDREDLPVLQEYNRMQYYRMFDDKQGGK